MLLLMEQKLEANENPFDLDSSNELPRVRAGLGQRNTCTQLLLNLAERVSKMPGDSTNWDHPQGEAEVMS